MAKRGRRDAEAPREGRGALVTTPPPGTRKGERPGTSEGKGQPVSAVAQRQDVVGFAPHPHPCPVVFHLTASSCGSGWAEGSPWLVAAGGTVTCRDEASTAAGNNWKRQDFFLFLTSAPRLVTKWLVLTQEGVLQSLSPGPSPRSRGASSPWPPALGPVALFHPHPFPLMTAETGEDLPRGSWISGWEGEAAPVSPAETAGVGMLEVAWARDRPGAVKSCHPAQPGLFCKPTATRLVRQVCSCALLLRGRKINV